MELSQIRYFLAVAETLNFTSAANACAVSQPALSKAIRKLEDTLGAELFDRSGHQVNLTEFGHTMRVHFELIEENRRKALEAARATATSKSSQLNVPTGTTTKGDPIVFRSFFGYARFCFQALSRHLN